MLFILFSIIGFFCGVGFAAYLPVVPAWIGLFLLPFHRKPKWPLVGAALLVGILRMQAYEAQMPEFKLPEWSELAGQVVEVDRRLDHQKVTVKTELGKVLIKLSPYNELVVGDSIVVKGNLESPPDDLEGFNYARYLARYRIVYWMPDARLVDSTEGKAGLRRSLFLWKERVQVQLNRLYFEPEASFAAGLLLGSRKGMPIELADAFQATGLTHIVAISGYNISLIVAAMFWVLSGLSMKPRILVTTFILVLFVLFVGASAAVVRAAVMGVLTLWGMFSGRKSQVFFALLWSAVFMVLENPYVLLYDVGFQLSFASTLGLLSFYPILNEWIPQRGGVLREGFLLTLSAQVLTLPLIAYHFERVSIISPFVNVLVAPFLPLAMFFSGFSLVFGKPLALAAWAALRAVELIALGSSKLPFAQVDFSLSLSGFWISIVLAGIWAYRFYKPTLQKAFGLYRKGSSSKV